MRNGYYSFDLEEIAQMHTRQKLKCKKKKERKKNLNLNVTVFKIIS